MEMDVFLKTSQKQHVFASQKLILGISLYRQASKDILKKVKLFNLAPSGSVSLSFLSSFYIYFLFSLLIVRIIIPESFLTSQVSITPFIHFLLFFSFSFSPFLIIRAFLWDHVRAQMIIKRVSSSFFFSPIFPRNIRIYIGRKSDSNW